MCQNLQAVSQIYPIKLKSLRMVMVMKALSAVVGSTGRISIRTPPDCPHQAKNREEAVPRIRTLGAWRRMVKSLTTS